MTETKTDAVVKREAVSVEYIPYGAQDKVKLSVAIVQNLVAVKTKSGKTCSERDALRFIAMCQAKRMNPFEEDCFLIGYDAKEGPTFSLVAAHQTYLKRAELHPAFDGMQSGIIGRDKDGKIVETEGDFVDDGITVVGAWAKVHFKNRKQPMYKRLSVKQRKPNYYSPFWDADKLPEQIVKCAEADAFRASFPTMCGGLYLREEVELPRTEFAKPDFSPAKSLFNGASAAAIEDTKVAHVEPEPPNQTGKAESPHDALKARCKELGIKEAELLAWMTETGMADGSFATVDDLPAELVGKVMADWSEISARVQGA
jgi:phage recombination protein Bet